MMKRILKSFFKFILIILLLLFLLWLPLWYMAKPINDFCNSLADESPYKSIILKAKELNYRVYDEVKNGNGELFIEIGKNSYLQMACHISFQEGKVIKKLVQNSF